MTEKTRSILWRNSIQTRLGVALLILINLVLVGFALFEYYESKIRMKTELKYLSEITTARLAQSLVFPIWYDSEEQVREMVRAEMLVNDIRGIIVREDSGKTILYGADRDEQWQPRDTDADISGDFFMSQTDIAKNGDTLGRVAVYVTSEFMKAEQRKETLAIATATVLIDIVLVIALMVIIRKSLTRPIKRVVEGLEQIEAGDLTTSIASRTEDEMGAIARAVNSMCAKVGTVVGDSIIISEELARTASEQAASVEETSASLEEMSSMVRQNADNSSLADALMKEAVQIIVAANTSMSALTKAVGKITRASEETSKIIKTIDEIAFQTNLLALNAAVEAARAGEAGAGFAVVAEEVRNLAMRSAEAARNTSALIEGTVNTVSEGTGLIEKTNTVFSKVSELSEKVGNLIGEISAASGEQAQGIEELNRTVSEMGKVTQQNAASSEQLRTMMRIFKTDAARQPYGEFREESQPVRQIPSAEPEFDLFDDADIGKIGDREVKPEQVIPFDEDDFRDF
ncbi:hypothetical protein DENIS_4721 [Desulfonema ishimotonii]|uniref:Methyl-accepting chemotaxis protein n=1 Tax=Desulfonema ishimotonii TaxID=45657 RepID=A0A401G3F0_9BACT|nr:methyl-accepting chemotaxis protein [Desulfonema ishimotonii]GBC63723.1 hypothetical protein DENIS_4721 [Desulfonema ishimotonii]